MRPCSTTKSFEPPSTRRRDALGDAASKHARATRAAMGAEHDGVATEPLYRVEDRLARRAAHHVHGGLGRRAVQHRRDELLNLGALGLGAIHRLGDSVKDGQASTVHEGELRCQLQRRAGTRRQVDGH